MKHIAIGKLSIQNTKTMAEKKGTDAKTICSSMQCSKILARNTKTESVTSGKITEFEMQSNAIK